MADTLPGMPLAPTDVFVCRIDQGADLLEREPPATRKARPGVWLVLALCSRCRYDTGRYCSWHKG